VGFCGHVVGVSGSELRCRGVGSTRLMCVCSVVSDEGVDEVVLAAFVLVS
jgi:hypothetical protein